MSAPDGVQVIMRAYLFGAANLAKTPCKSGTGSAFIDKMISKGVSDKRSDCFEYTLKCSSGDDVYKVSLSDRECSIANSRSIERCTG